MLKYLWTYHKFATIATVVVVLIIIWTLLYISFTPSYSTSNKNYSSSSNSTSSVSSGKVTGSGAGGYDMPKEGESLSEYIQRVDPDLYDSLFEGLYD